MTTTDDSRVLLATLAGAAVGGVGAYLFLTDSGRRNRAALSATLDEIGRELDGLRDTVRKVSGIVVTGWQLLSDIAGEDGSQARYPARQVSPF